jgi:hypothetical protein
MVRRLRRSEIAFIETAPPVSVTNGCTCKVGRRYRCHQACGQVLRLRGLPLVAVMEPADFRNRDDRTSGWE